MDAREATRPRRDRNSGSVAAGIGRTEMVAAAMVILVALAVGVVGARSLGLRDPPPPSDQSGEREVQVAYAFYGALDHYLESGDDQVSRLLAPGFRELGVNGQSGSSSDLLAFLDALHGSAIRPTFSVQGVRVFGTLVEVSLSTELPTRLDVAGLTVDWRPATTVEYLELERNVIVAHWSRFDLIPRIEPGLDASFQPDVQHVLARGFTFVPLSPAIQRIELEPGAEFDLATGGHYGLISPSASLSIRGGTTNDLVWAGESRFIATDGRVRIGNPGPTASSFWLISLEGSPAVSSAGATVETLVRTLAVQLPSGVVSLHLQIALVRLPPGTEIRTHQSGTAEVLAVVEGALEANVTSSSDRLCTPRCPIETNPSQTSYAAGEGASVPPGSMVNYRVSGANPATLLVATVDYESA